MGGGSGKSLYKMRQFSWCPPFSLCPSSFSCLESKKDAQDEAATLDYDVTDTHTKDSRVESEDGLLKPPYQLWAATCEFHIT